MRLSLNNSKRSMHDAYEKGKRGLNWADKRIRKLEQAFNIAAPVIGALQPDLIPGLAATKAALTSYNHARTIAIAGDKVKEALVM